MNLDNDYDNDGNNIVPCPICLDRLCPSNDGSGKCPEEDEYAKHMKDNKTIEEIVKSFCKYFDWEEDSEQAHELRQALQQYGESVRKEERETVKELIKEHGHQQEDDSIWCNMDELLKALSTKKDNQECNCETHPEHGKLHTQECVLKTLEEKDNQ